ncbi:hypothetical protein BGW80DRAFT_1426073 [Lactifluus volemus]|nr:hypothetical protein BGW80DRAFT_1426073 [Lactifluus volemus]
MAKASAAETGACQGNRGARSRHGQRFRGKAVTLGKERHRFCDPLFDRNLLDFGMSMTLQVMLMWSSGSASGLA